MNITRIIGTSFLLLLLSAVAAFAEQYVFTEACDGSAVVSVGDGYFLDATDEDNDIRLYKIGTPKPVATFGLDDYLKTERNKRNKPKEADIEAVARVGDRLYWIGSHSRDKKGELEVSRFKFLATNLARDGADVRITPVGAVYGDLLGSFSKLEPSVASALKAAKGLPPSKGGINIEGLAASASGGVLIGFRSPLVDHKALIVPLVNPAVVVEKQAEPAFGPAILLDLGGFGIRAIEPKAQSAPGSYWILGGPLDASEQSQLYEWKLGGQPVEIKVPLLATTRGYGEGLMVDRPTSKLFVSLDGGDVGDPECKDRPIDQRSFIVETVDQ